MNMENIFKDIMKSVYAELKPLGYKKDGQNFRLFQEDGLCKIINFQRDRWNTKESIAFTMNTGIYFEKDVSIQNKKFKEYECLIRNRLLSDKWWHIDADADCDAVKERQQSEQTSRYPEFYPQPPDNPAPRECTGM